MIHPFSVLPFLPEMLHMWDSGLRDCIPAFCVEGRDYWFSSLSPGRNSILVHKSSGSVKRQVIWQPGKKRVEPMLILPLGCDLLPPRLLRGGGEWRMPWCCPASCTAMGPWPCIPWHGVYFPQPGVMLPDPMGYASHWDQTPQGCRDKTRLARVKPTFSGCGGGAGASRGGCGRGRGWEPGGAGEGSPGDKPARARWAGLAKKEQEQLLLRSQRRLFPAPEGPLGPATGPPARRGGGAGDKLRGALPASQACLCSKKPSKLGLRNNKKADDTSK